MTILPRMTLEYAVMKAGRRWGWDVVINELWDDVDVTTQNIMTVN